MIERTFRRPIACALALLGAGALAQSERPGSTLLTATAVDAAGAPIAGARVVLREGAGPAGREVAAAVSAKDGTFALTAPPRTDTTFEVAAPGCAPSLLAHVRVERGTLALGEVACFAPTALRGRVVDSAGAPIAGARVAAEPALYADEPAASAAMRHETSAGRDGAGALEGLAPARWTVVASAPGRADLVLPGVAVREGAPPLELVLAPERILEGTVLDETGSAVEGARVLAARRDALRGLVRPPVETDPRGRFAVRGLDEALRDLDFDVIAPGCLPARIEGRSLADPPVLRLHRGRAVVARAPAGATLEEVRFESFTKVGDGWRQAAGAADSRTRAILAPDRWRVVAAPFDVLRLTATLAGGRGARAGDVEAAALAGDAPEIALEATPALRAQGSVVDGEGNPLADFPVVIEAEEGSATIDATTDANGRFDAEAPSARWRAVSRREGFALVEPAPASPRGRPGVRDAMPGQLVARATAALEGTLAFSGSTPGAPIPLLVHRLARSDRSARFETFAAALADASGRFAIGGLAPGEWVIAPKSPPLDGDGAHRSIAAEWPPRDAMGGRFVARVAAEGEPAPAALDVPRPQERAIEGSVWIDGAPAAGVLVRAIPFDGVAGAATDATAADGRYRLPVRRAGDWRLEVLGPGFRETRRVAVAHGQSRTIHFDLAPGSIAGTLVAGDGAPLPGLRVALQRARGKEREPLWSWIGPETSSDARGAFALPSVAPGRYRLLVTDPARARATLALPPMDLVEREERALPPIVVPREAPLRVSAGPANGSPGTGRVWVLAPDGAPLPAHLVQAWLWPTGDGFVLHGLPPGTWIVRLLPFEDVTVSLAADGSETHLRFEKLRAGEPGAPEEGSAYHAPEAREQALWDWGGEIPALYPQEDLGLPAEGGR